MTEFVLFNQTTVLQTSALVKVAPVLQKVFDQDFEPVWQTGLQAHISVGKVAHGEPQIPEGGWPVYLLDTTDEPGAGGYHLDDTGTPMGKVFVKDAMEANESWTVDLTHEFLEMCSDPTTEDVIPLPDFMGRTGYGCIRECGDAVEDDSFGYYVDGVLVTDWVTPEYFFQKRPADYAGTAGPFDYMGKLGFPAPALLHNGYLGILTPEGLWSQISAFGPNGTLSRRAKRDFGRLNRMVRRV